MSFCILNQQNMLSVVNMGSVLHSVTLLSPIRTIMCAYKSSVSSPNYLLRASGNSRYIVKHLSCLAASEQSDANPDSNPSHNSKSKPKRKTRRRTSKEPNSESKSLDMSFPGMIPKKPRRGRRGEAAAVEDFVRDRLEQTLETIKKQNPEILENMENFMKERFDGNASLDDDISDEEEDDDKNENSASGGKRVLIEEDDPDWPLDADIGWGIRASEYFDKHSIKNVVGEDGTNIDWEGEIDYGLVKEINCLEWESFAFHPSPLIVLVFERYNRASDNWRVLKELEKAAEVYWKAKDRLPPRTVKIDVNIERDLAYALKVRDCPQILFLRGNKILYREKESRSADELVQMIAHFFYNAKKPSCINDAFLSSHQ